MVEYRSVSKNVECTSPDVFCALCGLRHPRLSDGNRELCPVAQLAGNFRPEGDVDGVPRLENRR
jgi:hypothetical protein